MGRTRRGCDTSWCNGSGKEKSPHLHRPHLRLRRLSSITITTHPSLSMSNISNRRSWFESNLWWFNGKGPSSLNSSRHPHRRQGGPLSGESSSVQWLIDRNMNMYTRNTPYTTSHPGQRALIARESSLDLGSKEMRSVDALFRRIMVTKWRTDTTGLAHQSEDHLHHLHKGGIPFTKTVPFGTCLIQCHTKFKFHSIQLQIVITSWVFHSNAM